MLVSSPVPVPNFSPNNPRCIVVVTCVANLGILRIFLRPPLRSRRNFGESSSYFPNCNLSIPNFEFLTWWFQYLFCIFQCWSNDWSKLTSISFKWVGSTTNSFWSRGHLRSGWGTPVYHLAHLNFFQRLVAWLFFTIYGSYGKFTCFFWYFCLTGTGIYPLDHIGSVQVEQFHVFIYLYIYIYVSCFCFGATWRGYSLVTSVWPAVVSLGKIFSHIIFVK